MKQQTNRSVPFTPAEDTAMWNWCIQNPIGESLAQFWDDYRVANNSPRTVKSIRERFRRKVLPLLHLTTFEDSVKLELYKKMRAPINPEYIQRVHGNWDIQLNEHGHVIGYTARLYNILENREVEAPKVMPPPIPQTNLKRSSLESSGPLIPAKHVRFMNPEEAGDNGQAGRGAINPYQGDGEEEEELQLGNYRPVGIKNEPMEFNGEEDEEMSGEEDDHGDLPMMQFMGHPDDEQRENSTDDEEDDEMIQANVLQIYRQQQMEQAREQHEEHEEEYYEEEFEESPQTVGVPTEQSSSSIVSTDIVSLSPFLDAIKETVGSVVEKKLEEAVANVIRHQLAVIPDQINETIEKAVAEKMKKNMDEQKKKAELVDPKPFFLAMKRLVEDGEENDGMDDVINRLNAAIANLATAEKKVRRDKMELVMNMLLAVLNLDSFAVDDSN